MKEQGLFYSPDAPEPHYTDVVELDLADVVPSLAGPKRPQDRVTVSELKQSFESVLVKPVKEGGLGVSADAVNTTVEVGTNDSGTMTHGSTVIAAITSCTNTSNPSVMVAAGLLARNAVERGLAVKNYVKTSLAPGSQVVTEYYEAAGLDKYLNALGFYTVGYGCTTCIGNSGPLPKPVDDAIKKGDLVASSVLSGNRNFEGRVHQMVKANYLASPPLVIAYAIAGTVHIDLDTEPLGKGKDGEDVFLKDIWPAPAEVREVMDKSVRADMFQSSYGAVFEGSEQWRAIRIPEGDSYAWDDASTYVKHPPFFEDMSAPADTVPDLNGLRALALLGDTVTTDHISPAGPFRPRVVRAPARPDRAGRDRQDSRRRLRGGGDSRRRWL